MKSRAIVCALAAASMGFASLSFAQGYDRRGPGGDGPRTEQRVEQQRGFEQGRGGPNGFDHRDARNDRNTRYDARGPQFHRGGYIPREYRARQYVVNDWRGHRLAPPQRGQQWVQVGADYALIAIATGVIAQLVLH